MIKLLNNNKIRIFVIIDTISNIEDTVCRIREYFIKKEINFDFCFIIINENELKYFNNIIKIYNIENSIFSPFYNGRNTSFFKKHIYTNKKDILQDRKISIIEIFSNLSVNLFKYGKLTILENGNVYSCINNLPLGSLYKIDLKEAMYNEFFHRKNWFKTRENCKICSGCIYNFLCPPISNYEFVFKKNNLCKIYSN